MVTHCSEPLKFQNSFTEIMQLWPFDTCSVVAPIQNKWFTKVLKLHEAGFRKHLSLVFSLHWYDAIKRSKMKWCKLGQGTSFFWDVKQAARKNTAQPRVKRLLRAHSCQWICVTSRGRFPKRTSPIYEPVLWTSSTKMCITSLNWSEKLCCIIYSLKERISSEHNRHYSVTKILKVPRWHVRMWSTMQFSCLTS